MRTFAVRFGVLWTLALIAALLPSDVAAARGAPAWSVAQRVLSGQAAARLTATANGSVWGLGQASDEVSPLEPGHLVLMHRSPTGRWSTRGLPHRGFPEAIADDGRTTFFLYTAQQCGGSIDCELYVAKVPHGGRPSAARPLGITVGGSAALLVRDGRWWAVWPRADYVNDPADPGGPPVLAGTRLMQARTISPALAPQAIRLAGEAPSWPQLAWRGRDALLSGERRGAVELFHADAGGAWRPAGVRIGTLPAGSRLTVSGGRTFVTVVSDRRLTNGRHPLVLLQDDRHLRFSTRRLVPTRVAPGDRPRETLLAASGGRVFVGHDDCFVPTGTEATTCRGYVSSAGVGGAFRTREVTAPIVARNPGVPAGLSGLTAARGSATVALHRADVGVWVRSERRPRP